MAYATIRNMKAVPDLPDSKGYVVIHGDASLLASNPDTVEVIVASDGKPFPTSMEALVCGRVSCSLEWHVVTVRSAATLSRRTVDAVKAS